LAAPDKMLLIATQLSVNNYYFWAIETPFSTHFILQLERDF